MCPPLSERNANLSHASRYVMLSGKKIEDMGKAIEAAAIKSGLLGSLGAFPGCGNFADFPLLKGNYTASGA